MTLFGIVATLISMCILSIGIISISYGQQAIVPNETRKIQYYGCIDYAISFHCDPLHNRMIGYSYSGSSIKILDLEDENPFFVTGKYGKALEVRAPYREAIHVPSLSNMSFDDFSVSFWVKSTPHAEPVGQIVSYTNSRNTAGWFSDMTALNGTDRLIRFVLTDDSGGLIPSTDVPLKTGDFHQITGTFNGSNIRVYKDGQFVGDVKYEGNYSSLAGLPFTIGSAAYCASCNRWSGMIDDLRIYNKALSSDETKELFNNPDDTKSANLIAHWTLDGQFNDVSGNGNNGTESAILASMVFAPDGRLFYTEKNSGNIRIMKNDTLLAAPFATVNDIYVDWEQGLLGLTVDPNFAQNHYVYLYYTSASSDGQPFNRVVRFTDDNDKGKDMVVLLDKIPASEGYHSGGALAFGPDDKLYITVGDATEHPFAQDPSIVTGKILRINRDGSIPADNPFPNSPVYTVGQRNMYGIAFDNNGEALFNDNGDYYYDEINLLQKGGNYGFPAYQPPNQPPELSNSSLSILPLRSYWDTIAPTQMIYYQGEKMPLLKDKFIVGSYSGDLYVLRLDNTTKQIGQENRIDLENYPFKPVVGVSEAPNGDLYFGAYAIYKLNSTDIRPNKQYVYPVGINSSSSLTIEEMQFDPKESKMFLTLNNKGRLTSPKSVPPPSTLDLEIPKSLMNNIVSVFETETNKQLNFRMGNTTAADSNLFTIQLPSFNGTKLTLLGSTLATPGEQILSG